MEFSFLNSDLLNVPVQFLDHLDKNHYARRFFIILLYAILAKVADLFVDRLLKRIAAKTKFKADDKMVAILHLPICLSIAFIGMLHALVIPPPLIPPWDTVLDKIVKSLLLFLWWAVIIKEINMMNQAELADYLDRKHIDPDLFYFMKNVSRILILFAGIAWGLIIWEIDLTPLFASAGIAGIAIALAAKDTMANFIGGISLFADRAYKVGDYIILDSGERGEVVDMGIRSTKIKTRDDVMISIPNSILSNSKIINESAPEPRFRIRIDVGVAYGSSLRKVEKILLHVAEENEMLAKKPEPRVRVRAFADSSVNFQLLVWVRDPREKGLQTHNLLKAIYRRFDEEGITIPFPMRNIHIIPTPQDKSEPPDDPHSDA